LFNAQTRFDVYVVNVTDRSNRREILPLIIDEKGEVHNNIKPSKWAFLPNYSYGKVKRFFSLKKMSNKSEKVIYNSNEYNSKTLLKRRTAKENYPVVHTMTRKGMGIRWSSKNKEQYGIPKVILNFNEILYPYNDWKGEYGMSQLTFGIPINSKKNGDDLVKMFNSNDFKEAVKATKWGSFQTDYKMFYYLR